MNTVQTESRPIESRLIAQCRRCFHHGSRAAFYHSRPHNIPAFEDVCPRCRSTEVEIGDPHAVTFR